MNSRVHKLKKNERGFTLFEMLVTMSIFAVLTIFTLANYRLFDRAIQLESLAHEIALEIRKAQISSTSIQEVETGDPTKNFTLSRGVYFERTSAVEQKKFRFFSDHITENKVYTSGSPCNGSGECLYEINLPNGALVTMIRGYDASATAFDLDNLSISFLRPNPEAYLYGNKSLGGCASTDPTSGCVTTINRAEIIVTNVSGLTRTVTIWLTGHITIQ